MRREGNGRAAAAAATWHAAPQYDHDDDDDDDGGGRSHRYGASSRDGRRSGNDKDNNDDDEPFDYKQDRKLRRRAAKQAAKEQRIAAHARWVEQRRATRAQLLARKQQRRQRQEEQQQQKQQQQQQGDARACVTRSRRRSRASTHGDDAAVDTPPRKRAATARHDDDDDSSRRKDKGVAGTTRRRGGGGADTSAASAVDDTLSSTTTAATARTTTATVPRDVAVRVRRCINKLSVSNVVVLTRELLSLVGTRYSNNNNNSSTRTTSTAATAESHDGVVSRAMIVTAVAQCVDALCTIDAGVLTHTGTLPLAALLRGLQLLHGAHVAAQLLEQLCDALQTHLDAADESAADNVASVLAHWYLLCGLDALFVLSLLQMLLARASTTAGALTTRHVTAAACALALLRGCGAKLMKEAAAGVDAALRDVRRDIAATATTQQQANSSSSSSSSAANGGSDASAAATTTMPIDGVVRHDARALMATSTASLPRLQALVGVMGEIALGHTRAARRTTTEGEASVTAMLDELCALLPGGEATAESSSSSNNNARRRNTLRRVVQTASMLCGLTWQRVRATDKPPRWYDPAARLHDNDDNDDNDDSEAKKNDNDTTTRTRAQPSHAQATSTHGNDDDAAAALRRQQVHAIRQEARALAGQRLTSEHKRAIFQCVTSASDDYECFALLMQRDAACAQFADVCAVLLQCCYQEQRYNDYYASVLQRFCHARRACVKTLQFALWDRFKSVRVAAVDVAGYVNLACLVATLIEHGTFTLTVLRGLDLDDTSKSMSLFARVLVLRLLLQLPAARLTEVFFGGDGVHAHDVQTNTTDVRRCLAALMSRYFLDDVVASRWLPLFYDVVACNTSFADDTGAACDGGAAPRSGDAYERMLHVFMTRVRVAYKALRHGIE